MLKKPVTERARPVAAGEHPLVLCAPAEKKGPDFSVILSKAAARALPSGARRSGDSRPFGRNALASRERRRPVFRAPAAGKRFK